MLETNGPINGSTDVINDFFWEYNEDNAINSY